MEEPGFQTNALPRPQSRISPDALPDVPAWVVFIFATMLLFGLVMATLLYVVNFPPEFRWFHKAKGRRMHAYSKVEQHDYQLRNHNERSASSSSRGGYQLQATLVSGSTAPPMLHFRNMNKRGLVVDTQGTYTGLGLAVPDSGRSASSSGA
jgi:hypothetical protein